MRRRGFSVLTALTTVFVLVSGLASPKVADASSIFDNVKMSDGSFVISYHGQPWSGVACSSNIVDLAGSWKNIIRDESNWDTGGSISTVDAAGAIEDFEDALVRGNGWGVTQVYNTDAGLTSFGSSLLAYGGTQDTWLQIWWNDTGTASFASISPFGAALAATGNVHIAYIYFSGANGHQCEPRVTQHVLTSSAPNTLSVMAIDNDTYPYFHWAPAVLNFDITYPSGYSGTGGNAVWPAKYVAMGDSFSTGEGNDPFESGTGISGVNQCHRSSQAYPRLLQANTNLNLGSTAFVACSGATTADVLYGGLGAGNWSEGAQVDALSAATEVVTLTIGGNDVGFQEYLPSCIAFCGLNSITYNAIMDSIELPAFTDNLKTTYEEILDRAGNADVYVIGYPYMTALDAETCGALDFSGGRDVQAVLNTTIELAVSDVRAQSTDYQNRLHYVEVNGIDSPFEGKHLCNGGDSDFGSLTFHPNTQGHIDYATVVADAIG